MESNQGASFASFYTETPQKGGEGVSNDGNNEEETHSPVQSVTGINTHSTESEDLWGVLPPAQSSHIGDQLPVTKQSVTDSGDALTEFKKGERVIDRDGNVRQILAFERDEDGTKLAVTAPLPAGSLFPNMSAPSVRIRLEDLRPY